MTNKQRLELIQAFTSEDLTMSKKKRLERIYKIAHSSKTCPHLDWDEESLKDYEAFKEIGLI